LQFLKQVYENEAYLILLVSFMHYWYFLLWNWSLHG